MTIVRTSSFKKTRMCAEVSNLFPLPTQCTNQKIKSSHRCDIYCETCCNFFCCWQNHRWYEQEDHTKPTVFRVRCRRCLKEQDVDQNSERRAELECNFCHLKFGEKDSCLICLRFTDEKLDDNHHCPDCGVCKPCKEGASFHCNKCNDCILTKYRETHKCFEDDICTICYHSMLYSQECILTFECGHRIHETCWYNKLTRCPLMCHGTIVKLRNPEKDQNTDTNWISSLIDFLSCRPSCIPRDGAVDPNDTIVESLGSQGAHEEHDINGNREHVSNADGSSTDCVIRYEQEYKDNGTSAFVNPHRYYAENTLRFRSQNNRRFDQITTEYFPTPIGIERYMFR